MQNALRSEGPAKRGRKRSSAGGLGPRYAAPAVDQALDIVELLSRNSRAYGINELARTLSISTNTVYRILRRLTERGYTEQDASGGYHLSTQFFSLGMRLYSRFDLRIRARPHLERLAEQTHKTAQIHVPDKDRALALDCIAPLAEFFLATTPGSRFYYHPNAFGKAILAFLDPATVKTMVTEKLPALTSHTITSRKDLFAQFDKVRQTGLAYDMEEYNLGFFCIGSPVFDVTGKVVAGIGITGVLQKDTPSRFGECEVAVLRCAGRIAADIGYTGGAYEVFETASRGGNHAAGAPHSLDNELSANPAAR
jgi:DNA-binding IclR family transcriptional regulator